MHMCENTLRENAKTRKRVKWRSEEAKMLKREKTLGENAKTRNRVKPDLLFARLRVFAFSLKLFSRLCIFSSSELPFYAITRFRVFS